MPAQLELPEVQQEFGFGRTRAGQRSAAREEVWAPAPSCSVLHLEGARPRDWGEICF